MNGETTDKGNDRESTYLTYAGILLATIFTITFINHVRLGAYGWMYTWQLIASAIVTSLLAVMVARGARWGSALRIGAGTAYIAASAVLLIGDHRLFLLPIAALNTLALASIYRGTSQFRFLWIFAILCSSWLLTAGLPYTHLSDYLLNSQISSAAIPAFLIASVLAITELSATFTNVTNRRMRLLAGVAATIIFALFALRTDHFWSNWVPYHRSYFVETARLVRQGHWLLWDAPSLYGFLSILTIAFFPAANAWQSLYELTAIFLTAEALVIFAILRYRRSGWANFIFATLFSTSVVFGEGLARFAWGGRLYPQGGLRFIFVVLLVCVAFYLYVLREQPKARKALLMLGSVIWATSMFWSAEDGIWSTCIWIPYLLLDAAFLPDLIDSPIRWAKRAASRILMLPLLVAAILACIIVVYEHGLHHLPDFVAYVEYFGLFTTGKIRTLFWLQPYGAAWTLLLPLFANGAIGLYALATRRFALVPLAVAAWIAVWATSSYWAVEPLDEYVTLLLPVIAVSLAVAIFLTRELDGRLSFATRISILPIAVIVITYFLGSPSQFSTMRFPFSPGYEFSIIDQFPTINGELKHLLQRGGVAAGSNVLLPMRQYWTELRQGLIPPFARDHSGKIVEYRSWLPESPLGLHELFVALNQSRENTYVSRFLAQDSRAGWLVTYHKIARCSELSPSLRTVRRINSTNFSLADCSIRS